MIYILLLIFLIAYGFYYSMTKTFISPFSLLLISFIMSLTIITANMENWQVHINDGFPVYTMTAVLSFGAGCVAANLISGNLTIREGGVARVPRSSGGMMNYSWPLMCFLPVLCTLFFVALSLRTVRGVGSQGNIFRSIYEAAGDNSSSFVLHQLREIVVAVAEIGVIQAFAVKYVARRKMHKGFLIPIACFAVCTLFSTDRNIFLRFMIYALCLWILFTSSTSKRNVSFTTIQIVEKTALILVAAVGCFYLLGKLKSYTSNLERMIGIYGGSGLYNFNLCLEQLKRTEPQYGKETFSQLIKTLQVFGIHLGDGASNRAGLEMVVFRAPNGYVYASNIYSAMTPYVTDFGLKGVILFPAVMGLAFELLYIAAMRKGTYYFWGLYSMLSYGVVYFTIAEQFFMRFHLGMVYEIGWFTVFYYVVFGRKWIRIVH